ncbi:hypothetical protein K435DRAFT_842916 [Dendrothele bispora CBS 962.96]|uniref:Uncharacterized protein n=1 Tax=Dendrothele bispora (strain CBS 962.96) TaxID=1314807 RepID=A0A4S8LCB3_DENBC|nr:hypothetical protein K435DRAFT_842916 [Dendrothele bispora CBS 962.96]
MSSSNLLRCSVSSSSTNLRRSKSKLNFNMLADIPQEVYLTEWNHSLLLSATYGSTSSPQINLPSSPNGGLGTGDYTTDTGGNGEGPRIAARLQGGVWVFSDPKRKRGSHVLGGGVIPGSSRSGAPYNGYGEGSVEDGHGAWTDADKCDCEGGEEIEGYEGEKLGRHGEGRTSDSGGIKLPPLAHIYMDREELKVDTSPKPESDTISPDTIAGMKALLEVWIF